MLRSSGPGQVLGSYVANRVFAIRLVHWLGWVFETKERKKEIVISNSNVILTRQTCGRRSGMAAGGKRAERENFIFQYEFATCSKYRNVEYSRI